jgi:hypothetical protein
LNYWLGLGIDNNWFDGLSDNSHLNNLGFGLGSDLDIRNNSHLDNLCHRLRHGLGYDLDNISNKNFNCLCNRLRLGLGYDLGSCSRLPGWSLLGSWSCGLLGCWSCGLLGGWSCGLLGRDRCRGSYRYRDNLLFFGGRGSFSSGPVRFCRNHGYLNLWYGYDYSYRCGLRDRGRRSGDWCCLGFRSSTFLSRNLGFFLCSCGSGCGCI